jgi:hypothetical protein
MRILMFSWEYPLPEVWAYGDAPQSEIRKKR